MAAASTDGTRIPRPSVKANAELGERVARHVSLAILPWKELEAQLPGNSTRVSSCKSTSRRCRRECSPALPFLEHCGTALVITRRAGLFHDSGVAVCVIIAHLRCFHCPFVSVRCFTMLFIGQSARSILRPALAGRFSFVLWRGCHVSASFMAIPPCVGMPLPCPA